MRKNARELMVSTAAAVLLGLSAAAEGTATPVLSNAELLRTSGNVSGSGYGTASASFALTSGSVGVLDWDTLNVRAGESLTFGGGTWYNAVTGTEASEIAGRILGSGADVYLFNPNGVIFSSGSAVDVGTLTAAGFRMTNLDMLLADPTIDPKFSKDVLGDIEVNGATFDAERVNLLGRSVYASGTTFSGDVAVGAGREIVVDGVGGGIVSFTVSGESGDASVVDALARRLEIEAAGNVRVESSGDLALESVSAGKNVTAVAAEGAVSVRGRVAAKKDVSITAGTDVGWTSDGLLRAGGNVRVESTGGNVALGGISAEKASVKAAGNVTGRLGAKAGVLESGETACATYRIDADGTVVVSFESATLDVRGRKGVTLTATDSLTLAPVSVSTVRLGRGTDSSGNPKLVAKAVSDGEMGGYQSPAKDVELSVPGNLTVNGTIRTLDGKKSVDPDSVSLVSQKGGVTIGADIAANRSVTVEAGQDVLVGGSVASEDGTVSLTADGSVSVVGSAKANDVRLAAETGNVTVDGTVSARQSVTAGAGRDILVRGAVVSDGTAALAADGSVSVDGSVKANELWLESGSGDVTVGGTVGADELAAVDSGRDIRIDGTVASDGELEVNANGAVALGRGRRHLVSDDITITVDASGNPTTYAGAGTEGVLVLTRTRKGASGRLTSSKTLLMVDGAVAGGAVEDMAPMLALEGVSAEGNSAIPVRDPHAALSASRFAPGDVGAQLPAATNAVKRDLSALARASREEEQWTLKNVQE